MKTRVSKICCILAIIFSISGRFLYASDVAGPGSSAVLTLLEPFSAAGTGKSNAVVSDLGEAALINKNPASLNWLSRSQSSFMYRRGIDADNYIAFVTGIPLKYDAVGMGVQYYSTGDISLYDLQGDKITGVGQRDTVIHLAAATSNFNIATGINLKWINSQVFGKTGSAVAVDIGSQYKEENYNFGIAVRNLGTDIRYLNHKEKLPLNIAVGLLYTEMYDKVHLFKGNFDGLYYVNEKEYVFLTGLEYVYDKQFVLRGGYKYNITSPGDQDILLTTGVGFNFKNITVDYALKLAKNIDSPHTVSLDYRF
ncbi:MAG: PorV/PorQ family protein [Elusimicrobiota bacterium]